ncbi:MAG: twin-arginine translocase subunit TatB [Thiotrichaceae bacterium]|nr:twin-arginine translocase subunit TatB [Thiotrichaceae bacterium]
MFESGFLEILVIGVIALLVVGPERLPGIARKVGGFVGKARAFINTTKADIAKEIQAEEMKAMLTKQEDTINELKDMMQDAQGKVQDSVQSLDENLLEKTGFNTASEAVNDEKPKVIPTQQEDSIHQLKSMMQDPPSKEQDSKPSLNENFLEKTGSSTASKTPNDEKLKAKTVDNNTSIDKKTKVTIDDKTDG